MDVINSAIPTVMVNIGPPAAIRPVIAVPAVPPQRGNVAIATGQGTPGSRIVTRTSVSRRFDEDD